MSRRSSFRPRVSLRAWLCLAWLATGCGDENGDASADGGDLDAGCTMRCAPDETPEGCGCTTAGARMRLGDLDGDFYAQPWPLATRLALDGALDLDDFPLADGASLIRDNLDVLASETRGFGTNAAIFVSFDGPLDPASLPEDARASLEDDASVYLVDVDDGSADLGERVPIECRYRDAPSDYAPARFLACLPFPGFPLRPDTTYALVLTDALRDADGEPVRASQRWRDVLDGSAEDTDDEGLVAAFAPLADFARAEALDLDDLVGGTVFRTQNPVAPMRAIAADVAAMPAPTLEALAPYDGSLPAVESGNYVALRATYETPIYQRGVTPYTLSGGDIRFRPDGSPVVATTTTLRATLTLPTDGPMPATGWPVVLYHHGTNGDAASFVVDGTAYHLARAGVAAIGIDAPVHGARRPAGVDSTLLFFNIDNLSALRDNVRQGAADLLVLERVVAETDVDAPDSPTGDAIRFDPERIFFMGHSQGALTGALYLGVSPAVRGAMLSGAGGSVTMTILFKRNPIDIPALARLLLALPADEPLDAFHPALALVQSFTEPVDPLNFAPYAYRREGGRGYDLWLTQGLLDQQVPTPVTAALATAYGVSPVAPEHEPIEGFALRDEMLLSAPVSANVTARDGTRFTGVYAQYPNDGHFLIMDNAAAEARLTHWFETLANDGTAELAAD